MGRLRLFFTRSSGFAFLALICVHLLAGACFAEWMEIRTIQDLQAINTESDGGNYRLMNDIDASGFAFKPIADFYGFLEGQGFKVFGLTIEYPEAPRAALFSTNRGAVKRLGLEGVSIKASGIQQAAGVAGINHGTIGQTYVTGSISGAIVAGGIVAQNQGSVAHCFTDVSISSTGDYVGGIAGINDPGFDRSGIITNSYSSGYVSGNERVGGLAGENSDRIYFSYSKARVSGEELVGGLTGVNTGTLFATFAKGQVEGHRTVGGLVGSNVGVIMQSYSDVPFVQAGWRTGGGLVGNSSGRIYDSYAKGIVGSSLGGKAGGLAGVTSGHNRIYRTYSACLVSRPPDASHHGGLIGHAGLYSDIRSSYWDKDRAGSRSAAGSGRTTAQMQRQSNYSGWDFKDVWKIDEGRDYPELRWDFSMEPFPDPPQNPEIPIDVPDMPGFPDIPDIPDLPDVPHMPDFRPQPPENLRAAPGDGEVTLTWDESPSTRIQSYRIYARVPESLFTLQASVPADTTEYVDGGLTNNVTYIYTVRSFSELGLESGETSNTAWAIPGTDESKEEAPPHPDQMPPPEGEAPDEEREDEDDDDSSGCFIATAAYGSCMSSEVVYLRVFRDGFLLRSAAGNYLVRAYYSASPAFAEVVEGSSILGLIVRLHLAPVVKAAGWIFN